MPELGRFFGIVIRMFYGDHEPAHFHAIYGEYEALIEVETLSRYSAVRCPDEHSRWYLNGLHSIAMSFAKTGAALATENRLTRSSLSIEENIMALLRIRDVQPLEGFTLRLMLNDGSVIERNVSRLLVGPVFELIRKDPAVFARVRVEGGTVVWPNGADLCPDVLIWGGAPPEEGAAATPSAAGLMRGRHE